MEKIEIDNYFTENYTELGLFISKSFSKHSVMNEDPLFFLSEMYTYMIERKDSIEDVPELKKYISTFIHNNSYWTNSGVREAESYSRRMKLEEYIPSKFENEVDSEYEVEVEEQMNEYKAVIEMYYQSLTSLSKKASWEIYFIEKKQTVKDFAEHIQMSRTVADKFIKELKTDIRAYYSDYKREQCRS